MCPPTHQPEVKRARPFLHPDRLLSVQSHVVSGYVGNRAATFPLQLLGYDVDAINTVQFSNHTGYGHTNGHKTTPEQLTSVFSGLETNGLSRWAKVLTGYIPGASALTVVGDEVRKLRDRARAGNPQEDVVYLLDPVMGDIGKGLYVAEDVIPIYRQLLSQATIITPNQFETELLTERKIDSIKSLYEALDVLHSSPHSVPHVAISSIPLPRSLVNKLGLPGPPLEYTSLLPQEGKVEQLKTWGQKLLAHDDALKQKLTDGIRDTTAQGEDEPMVLACFASTKTGDSKSLQTFGFALPTVEGYFSGVGDLFSALVLGFYKPSVDVQPPPAGANGRAGHPTTSISEQQPTHDYRTGDLPPFAAAVSKALLGVQQILLNTHLHTLELASVSKKRRADRQEEAECSAAVVPEEEDCVPSDPELDSLPPTPVSKGALPIPARTARRMRMRELRIIQEKDKILTLADDDQVGWPASLLNWSRLLQDEKVPE
ncbi:hypothetical protein QFC19_001052 [Naganishia cerealis]|uniref:Uncharacterized protein n=1 Tax=Naganishia cerealis TaxID=610337 RepID=A0ACC2WJW2_9TREE|nr:hypothetical protein QFC19_001052 [Naganishia cerealis]